MKKRYFQKYQQWYSSLPEAARELGIPLSTFRTMLTKKWMDGAEVERKPEDILEVSYTKSKRKLVSQSLIEKMAQYRFKAIG